MNRFQEPDCLPLSPEQREAENIGCWDLRKAAERLALKDELVEAFYQMGYSLRGERVLHDSNEVEYEFKSGDRIIKVTTSPSLLAKGVGASPKLPSDLKS